MKTTISHITRSLVITGACAVFLAVFSGCSKSPTLAEKAEKELIALQSVVSNHTAVLTAEKEKAQSETCIAQLKMIGIAFRMYALDYGNQPPFKVSTNSKGTLELCQRGEDGYDLNGVAHFKALVGQTDSPKIFTCPADSGKTPAFDFESLGSKNIWYQMRTGTNINLESAGEIVVRCPIHNHRLYCDGHVEEGVK